MSNTSLTRLSGQTSGGLGGIRTVEKRGRSSRRVAIASKAGRVTGGSL
nr:hypothetical protein [Streptomyces sp. FT05W]